MERDGCVVWAVRQRKTITHVIVRGNSRRGKNVAWSAQDLRDALFAVHSGEITSSTAYTKYNGVSKRHLDRLVKQIPENAADTEQRKTLTRANNNLAGLTKHAVFTTWELREAIIAVVSKKMKPAKAREQFGPADRTLCRWCEKARKLLPQGADEKKVR